MLVTLMCELHTNEKVVGSYLIFFFFLYTNSDGRKKNRSFKINDVEQKRCDKQNKPPLTISKASHHPKMILWKRFSTMNSFLRTK